MWRLAGHRTSADANLGARLGGRRYRSSELRLPRSELPVYLEGIFRATEWFAWASGARSVFWMAIGV